MATTSNRLPPIVLPPANQAGLQHLEAELQQGKTWDDEHFTAWFARNPEGAAQKLRAWGLLDMQTTENYGTGAWSPLMSASGFKDVALRRTVVAALIEQGANVNVRTEEGSSVLGIAMLTGDLDVVQQLLASGADPTLATVVGVTPLHHATHQRMYGSPIGVGAPVDLARALINAGADVNARTLNEGTTPLQYIMGLFPDMALVELLVEHGADPLVKREDPAKPGRRMSASWSNPHGDTLLHIGQHASPDVIRGLIRLGVGVDEPNAAGVTPLAKRFVDHDWNVGAVDALRGERYRQAIATLLSAGANPNVQDHEGLSPWQRLVQEVKGQAFLGDRFQILHVHVRPLIRAMVEAGADMDACATPTSPTCAELLATLKTPDPEEHRRWVEGLELRSAALKVVPNEALAPIKPRVRL